MILFQRHSKCILAEQRDFDDELILNEMVARKLRRGNENRCARHAMERAVQETPMKSKKNARQKHAQYVRAQATTEGTEEIHERQTYAVKEKGNYWINLYT